MLEAAEGIVGVAESGVWFPARRRVPEFPAAGEWIAAGAWLGAAEWERALARCGGDFSRLPWWAKRPSAPPAMLLSPAAARRFGARLRELGSVEKTWRAMLRSSVRVVHLPEFDARFSSELRVLQVVTSIQIGGAERVALDLPAAAVVTGNIHITAIPVVALGAAAKNNSPLHFREVVQNTSYGFNIGFP